MYGPGGGVERFLRERSPIVTTAMAIIAAPPMAPPTIAAVCELFLEDPEVGESPDLGADVPVGNAVVKPGKPVAVAAFVPVGPEPAPEVEALVPINAPGPISGPSKNRKCEVAKGKTKKILTTDSHRFEGIPKGKIFALSWAISTARVRQFGNSL
jgi:hypothetical protein